ncbi:hypothetical protein GGTG_00053 [Gaeumannomyces tritici R3-111a-1]|uniref:Uncharacterized protein n=1 Tax=Gaeumannomyces tritici (strain R3-111a-1) TaxID=644352 RepID=J3NFK7_GAET3|nr:hypothetical protein GGTG_00053 [Gaeumannomyces tritici R3-111a-1]EJT80047.1 hypothetical protein GGTG_00053 [Gaeumannomyces tritici R3-111a-1]
MAVIPASSTISRGFPMLPAVAPMASMGRPWCEGPGPIRWREEQRGQARSAGDILGQGYVPPERPSLTSPTLPTATATTTTNGVKTPEGGDLGDPGLRWAWHLIRLGQAERKVADGAKRVGGKNREKSNGVV